MVGGAPVIQLTLTPRASFNGVNAPKISAPSSSPPSASAERNAIGFEGSAPEKPTPRPSTSTAPSVGPTTISARPPGTSVRPGEQDGTIRTTVGQASQTSESGLTSGGGAPIVGASAASTADVYEAQVLAWIERHKHHPGGPAGAVVVGFTLDRRGKVRSREVLTSSGIGSLDHAALSQLEEAEPFPRPPSSTSWRTRDFIVRIDFRTLRASE
ncbi:TonB family protein [Brevundimonas faecalis]|uniref:TonB family protein n=1 Tax=Brevundimonas faecalis TaxID=947378 RepID=UPI00360B273D